MKKKTAYFENLDALRGIAFTMVFVFHFFGYVGYNAVNNAERYLVENVANKGYLGVNLFFVLSGFLITFLLLDEKSRTGKINIPFFYARRVLRIWPLFFLALVTGFFIFPVLTHRFSIAETRQHLPFYLLFLNNFDLIRTGFFGTGADSLGILWSVAVEEQFYLFWPLLLFFIPKRYYPGLFLLVIGGSLCFRAFHSHDPDAMYFHTFSVMSDLAVGATLAVSAASRNKLFHAVKQMPRWMIGSIYIIMAIVIYFLRDWGQLSQLTRISERLVVSVFFAFIIAEQCFASNSPFKLGRLRFFGRLGIISYGLYCLHMYGIVVVQKFNSQWHAAGISKPMFFAELLVSFLMNVLVCYLSYHFYEKKILKYKSKFSPFPAVKPETP